MREQTYIMIKPDGVQRGLIGNIIMRFEAKGFKLVAMKLMSPTKGHLENHYADLKTKSFFPGLIKYMMMGPVLAMVWEGDNVVKTGRKMLGETKPLDSMPGTIRGDLCIDVGRNIIHGSDSVEAAQAEIKLWFPEGINTYTHHSEAWVYEKVEAPAADAVATKETDAPATTGTFDQYTCYDDDACLGKKAPALAGLKICQGTPVAYGDAGKPTIVLFWAKFLKWQVHDALKQCETIHQSGKANVVGIATDPKESSVMRHIEKGECPTTYALAFDAAKKDEVGNMIPGGEVKNAFKEVCDGTLQVPQVFLISKEGKIVWRQPFSTANPLAKSNFQAQFDSYIAGKPLIMNGPAPKEDEESEEDEAGEEEETVDLVDPLAADVDW